MSQLKAYDLYLSTLDLINVEQRGQLTIDRFNRMANDAIGWFVDYLTGRLQDMPDQKLTATQIQKITDLLSPMIKKKIGPFNRSVIAFPDGYNFLLDLRITGTDMGREMDCSALPEFDLDQILSGGAGFRQIDVLPHDRVPARLNTYIPMLKKRAFAEQYADGWTVHPYKNTGSAFVAYLSEPAEMKLVMKLNPNTKGLEYDDAGTINPGVDKKAKGVLARKISQLFFHWTREGDAIQSSDAVAQTE